MQRSLLLQWKVRLLKGRVYALKPERTVTIRTIPPALGWLHSLNEQNVHNRDVRRCS